MSAPAEFGRLRSFLWPIHRSELKKVIPMLLIFFLICFNYNVLRATKDALIVTAPDSGAEALPFIKVWAIIPAVFLMTYLYTRVSNRFTREKVFYVMTLFSSHFSSSSPLFSTPFENLYIPISLQTPFRRCSPWDSRD